MTRTTVYRGLNDGDPKSETLADAFHEYEDGEETGPVVEVCVDGGATYALAANGNPVDVLVDGFPSDHLDEEEFGRKYRTYEVRLNGEEVESGLLVNKVSDAVAIQAGGRVTIPPGQTVEIDVYGEEVSD